MPPPFDLSGAASMGRARPRRRDRHDQGLGRAAGAGKTRLPPVFKSPWPGVTRKRAKGRFYWYWTRSTPFVRLPDPYSDTDAFMRKVAHLGRVAGNAAERSRSGTFGGVGRALSRHARLHRPEAEHPERLQPLSRPAYPRLWRRANPRDHPRRLSGAGHGRQRRHARRGKPHAPRRPARSSSSPASGWPALSIRPPKSNPMAGGASGEPWPAHILAAALASDHDEFSARRRAALLHTGQRTGDTCAMAMGVRPAATRSRLGRKRPASRLPSIFTPS